MIRFLVATCFASLIGAAHGQAGANDPSFNPNDTWRQYNGPSNEITEVSILEAVVLQSDGKILIGGNFIAYKDTLRNHLARLNTDGSLDLTFNAAATTNYYVQAIAVQSDGKILIGGYFTSCNGQTRMHIARLNSDGSLDLGFNPGSGPNAQVNKIIPQPDGKILIVGEFTTYAGVARSGIARIESDGGLDTGFDPGTGTNNYVLDVCLQPDGKFIIGGMFTSFNGTQTGRCARINSDGSLDSGFISGTGADQTVNSLALQSDGKVVLVGPFASFNGASTGHLVRLDSDGSVDSGFDTGSGMNSTVNSVLVQPDGKVLIAGEFEGQNGSLSRPYMRLNTDGTLDPDFNVVDAPLGSQGKEVVIQGDGKFLLGGDFVQMDGVPREKLGRLNSDGSLDHDFNRTYSVDEPVTAIQVQPDGKILIAGYFRTYNEAPRWGIARLFPDGALDTTFISGVGSGFVRCLFLQPDGKILIGGFFDTYNGTARDNIARINSDGSLDLSFVPGTTSTLTGITQLPNGKVLIASDYYNQVRQLNSDGSVDVGFNLNQGLSTNVYAMAPLVDGRILVGGSFYSSGQTRILAMLDSLGNSIPFGTGTGQAGSVWCILVQPDGKFLIGGEFSSYDGVPVNNIARVNSDGSLDPTFQPGSGPNSGVASMALQANGSIVIGGDFDSYNGTDRERIARIHTDGSLDTGFDPGTGVGSNSWDDLATLAIRSDGRILIGGDFEEYNGALRYYLAGILVEDDIGIPEVEPPEALLIAPNPTTDRMHFAGLDKTSHWSIRDMEGRLLLQGDMLPTVERSIDVSDLASGSYLLTVQDGAARRTAHFDKL